MFNGLDAERKSRNSIQKSFAVFRRIPLNMITSYVHVAANAKCKLSTMLHCLNFGPNDRSFYSHSEKKPIETGTFYVIDNTKEH